jgi:oxygen-independent coproporphyrinogen-3 oxidase
VKTLVAQATRTGEWLAEPGFGVYVHIPFCAHRCHYCDFNTYEGLDALHGDYVDSIIRVIDGTTGDLPPATSVFFGGGTPTLLPAEQLGRMLIAARDRVGFSPDAEITVEANPETVDESYFERLLEAGFNRVSIGIQSLVPHVLAGLGRRHAPDVAVAALTGARRAGVPDLNADLIYGSPWETDEDWRRSLEGIIAIAPDHVSAYALTIEEATPLATLVRTGRVPDVDPDIQAERHAVADELLAAAGYARYEVSNWSQPGRASRHNVLYWSDGNYLGIGAGAHGHLDGRRYWNTRLPRDFIAEVTEGRSTEAGSERLASRDRAGEALMLGLRLVSGIEVGAFDRRFPGALDERIHVITRLEADGWLERTVTHLRLTSDATMLANDVLADLL